MVRHWTSIGLSGAEARAALSSANVAVPATLDAQVTTLQRDAKQPKGEVGAQEGLTRRDALTMMSNSFVFNHKCAIVIREAVRSFSNHQRLRYQARE
jgi:hypothetical protein